MVFLNFLKAGAVSMLLSHVVMADLQPDLERQKQLTPDWVLERLKAGNERYVEGKISDQNLVARIEKGNEGQYPKAYILSCVDSRVPAELVYDMGLGDVFVGRVAGNIENSDQLGSMEYASAVAGVKLIVVMGHESCGAVKSACDDVKIGNISGLLQKIRPAVRSVDGYEAMDSKNKSFVKKVIKSNVLMTIQDIRKKSEVLDNLEKSGKIKIVGAYYNLKDGSVNFLDEKKLK